VVSVDVFAIVKTQDQYLAAAHCHITNVVLGQRVFIVSICCQARSQVLRLGSGGGEEFCFFFMFTTNFSGHHKIRGALPPNAPRDYGRVCGTGPRSAASSLIAGNFSQPEMEEHFMASFSDICSGRDGRVSYVEFVDYYEGVSIMMQNDDGFVNMMRNCWGV